MAEECGLDLYWIPLGAGGHVVRLSGRVYEAIVALVQRRPRRPLYHSALIATLPSGCYVIEMTPIPPPSGAAHADAAGEARGVARGVVAEGAVGSRWLGRFRVFRYEIRCWLDGSIPDLSYAVGGPVRVAVDEAVVRAVVDLAPAVPTPVWGRDELRTGEMWNSNSVTSWLLATTALDVGLAPPGGGRAPGWGAGRQVAARADRRAG